MSKIVINKSKKTFSEKGSSIVEIMFCLLGTSLFALIFLAHRELLNIFKGGEMLFADKKKEYSFSDNDNCSEKGFKKGFLEKYCCNEEKLQCAVYIVSTNSIQ